MDKEHRNKVAVHARSMRRNGYPNSTVKASIRIHRIAAAAKEK